MMALEAISRRAPPTAVDPSMARDVLAPFGATAALEYATDFWQRSMLFLDILRRSGNKEAEITSRPINAVLIYDHEVVVRGRSLPRPVNYALLRVLPPDGVEVDPARRPVVVIDPRAGQGPGIGGFKPLSEIGEAFAAGHPVYFIGFTAEPVDGQTIEDVALAHTVFLEKVTELHPGSQGKPFLIGNCQAGWHAVMAACMRPDVVGPVMVAGAPLSYWAGVHGRNPMRYAGGLAGGTWLARMLSDLGGGTFDGAWLISNFDSLNPANTLWRKQYDVWADPERQEERYLRFETWWGDFVELRGEELQYMVDNLFVGNELSTGRIVTRDGIRLDMRNVKSPILCFCSQGDNITPPQQALDWILDNYDSVDEIRRHGQTILYCIDDEAGHLAIFVGSRVAAKEDFEFINYMDLIDSLPPGLYEIVITDKREGEIGDELVPGDYNVRIEERDVADIAAMGCNSPEDDREFETVARVSEVNNALYAAFVQPWLKAWVTPQVAAAARAMQPLRLGYALCSDRNPMMRAVAPLAAQARAERRPADPGNPFVQLQQQVSEATTQALEGFGALRDQVEEALFHAVYGSPWLQAWMGVSAADGPPRPKPGTSPEQQAAVAARDEALRATIGEGGPFEAVVRALVYVAEGQHAVDARSFETLRRLVAHHPEIDLHRCKAVVRAQSAILGIDERAALATLPSLLPEDAGARRGLFEMVRAIRTAAGPLAGEARRRLDRIEAIFAGTPPPGSGRRPGADDEETGAGRRAA